MATSGDACCCSEVGYRLAAAVAAASADRNQDQEVNAGGRNGWQIDRHTDGRTSTVTGWMLVTHPAAPTATAPTPLVTTAGRRIITRSWRRSSILPLLLSADAMAGR